LLRKRSEVERLDTGEFEIEGDEIHVMNNLTYVDEMEDCSIKQEQNDRKIYLLF